MVFSIYSNTLLDDSECCDTIRIVSSGYFAREESILLGSYKRSSGRDSYGYSLYTHDGGYLFLVLNRRIGEWVVILNEYISSISKRFSLNVILISNLYSCTCNYYKPSFR